MPTMLPPYTGMAVHYVNKRGGRCDTALVEGLTHPGSGDDDQWCVALDVFWGGVPQIKKDHVPHGTQLGHWHRQTECGDTNGW